MTEASTQKPFTGDASPCNSFVCPNLREVMHDAADGESALLTRLSIGSIDQREFRVRSELFRQISDACRFHVGCILDKESEDYSERKLDEAVWGSM